MKKLVVLLFGIVALTAFAGTCVVQKVKITDINGKGHYGAEMKNDSGADILNHKFKVAFLDDNGNVLETKSVDGCLRSLQNGAVDYFSAQSTKDADDVAVGLSRIDGPLTFGLTGDGDIEITDVEATRNGDSLVVTAKVKNTGNDDLEDVRICVIVRDEDGNVQAVKRSGEENIDEDDTHVFDVTVDVADDNDDSKTVDVVGDGTNPSDDDKPIEPVINDDNSIDECNNTPTNTPTGSPTLTPTNTVAPTDTATATPVGTGTATSTSSPTSTNTPLPDAC
jgi:hypothetical protein